jgi:flagellar hook-length control protein FliK
LNINQFQQNWKNLPEPKGNSITKGNDISNISRFDQDLKRSNERLEGNKDKNTVGTSLSKKDVIQRNRNDESNQNNDPGYAAVQFSQSSQVTSATKKSAVPQSVSDLSPESGTIHQNNVVTNLQSPPILDNEDVLYSRSALSGIDNDFTIRETAEASISSQEENIQELTSVKPFRPPFSQSALDRFSQNSLKDKDIGTFFEEQSVEGLASVKSAPTTFSHLDSDSFGQSELADMDKDVHSALSQDKNIFSQPLSSQAGNNGFSSNLSENLGKALQDLETELSMDNNNLVKQIEPSSEQQAFSAKNQMNLSVDANGSQKLGMPSSQISESSDLSSELSITGFSALASLKGRDSSQEKGQQNFDGQQQDLQGLINDVQTDTNLSSLDRFAVDMENGLNTPSKTSDSQIDNMESIVRQARSFIKDGGGSMEIHLQPEGLGKVQLKVNVHEGKVNVEMMTDNPAAKKALEEGLFDVKNALEGQKLIVDTLKVEMSQDYQRDFTDLKDHMQEQANRDFAQDFLEQFRQDRQSRFTGMIDRFRDFPQTTSDSELKLAQNNHYASGGKGQTLNLVA